MEVEKELKAGRIWQIQPVSGKLVYALQAKGVDYIVAIWLVLRRSIVLGGGEKQYNKYREEFIHFFDSLERR